MLPGNNYHVYDYALFWANIRADAEARLATFLTAASDHRRTPAEFRDALPAGGRLLGLDVGTKTIGIALCDSGWTIATPAELMRRGKFARGSGAAAGAGRGPARSRASSSACRSTSTAANSPRTQSVRAFARNLAPLGLPILLWDERWSTQAVTRTLIDADASRARRAELVDKMAAAYILQGAIDALTMG